MAEVSAVSLEAATLPIQEASVLERFGPPSVLSTRLLPCPEPGRRQVLVRVEAAAVNHLDLDIRAGKSRLPVRLPHVLGREAAGTVVAVGDDVQSWTTGDRVLVSAYPPCGRCQHCGNGDVNLCENPQRPGIEVAGGYARFVLAPDEGLYALAPELSFSEAACAQLAFGTAWHAIVTRAALQAGETVLVLGAAGGTGSAAVQVAKLHGARVIAAVGSEEKAAAIEDLGADEIVCYRTGLTRAVHSSSVRRHVDLVVDGVGGSLFLESLDLLRPSGRLVLYGAHSGEQVNFDLLSFFRSYTAIIASRGWRTPELKLVLEALATGDLRVFISRCLPLSEAAKAHTLLEQRSVVGKLILKPGKGADNQAHE